MRVCFWASSRLADGNEKTDDGSSFFNDTSNVIFMGWGQKTFEPSPGRKFTRDSLILFTSSVLTEHGGES